jgi:hypothetical protein
MTSNLTTHDTSPSAPPLAEEPALPRLNTALGNAQTRLTQLLGADGLPDNVSSELLELQTSLATVATLAEEVGQTYKAPVPYVDEFPGFHY